jgi:histidyl-tRNA synthetase
MELKKVSEIKKVADISDNGISDAIDELVLLTDTLGNMGIGEYCEFDPGIVRGLAYYTGIVFEVQDIAGELRAVCGGGRYDNLLKDLGGPAVSGTGIAMGDCVLEILLREKGLLRDEELAARNLDYFVAYTDSELQEKAVEIIASLRSAGFATEFSYKGGGLKKQLKQASAVNAKICVIIGQEFIDSNELVVKDMATGEQKNVKADKFISQL